MYGGLEHLREVTEMYSVCTLFFFGLATNLGPIRTPYVGESSMVATCLAQSSVRVESPSCRRECYRERAGYNPGSHR